MKGLLRGNKKIMTILDSKLQLAIKAAIEKRSPNVSVQNYGITGKTLIVESRNKSIAVPIQVNASRNTLVGRFQ